MLRYRNKTKEEEAGLWKKSSEKYIKALHFSQKIGPNF